MGQGLELVDTVVECFRFERGVDLSTKVVAKEKEPQNTKSKNRFFIVVVAAVVVTPTASEKTGLR